MPPDMSTLLGKTVPMDANLFWQARKSPGPAYFLIRDACTQHTLKEAWQKLEAPAMGRVASSVVEPARACVMPTPTAALAHLRRIAHSALPARVDVLVRPTKVTPCNTDSAR